MQFNTILVPVDFSSCSFLVAQQVGELARVHEARTVFLHVGKPPAGIDLNVRIHPDSASGKQGVPLSDYIASQNAETLDRYASILHDMGLEAASLQRSGSVAETILGVADEIGADLITMGTHGREGLTRLMLGSVAESVVRHATIPVLTLRSIHQPSCEASSCSTCLDGAAKSGMGAAMAEADG